MTEDVRVPPPSELAQERLASADDRRFRWIGILIVLIVFGGFGTWAVLAPLSSAASAPGVIAVESYRKTVQHLEGGIVKAIHVRDGQTVQKDQVLITLEDTQPRAQLEVLRGQHYILQAREARLGAQRDGLAQVRYGSELLKHQADERVQEAMRVQNQTFKVRKTAYEGEIAVYEQQIGQLKAKSDGLRSQRSSREQLVSSFRGELDDFQALLKEGYTEKQKVRELERNWANSSGQLGELTSNLAAIDLQVSETRLKILQLQKEMQREVAKELSEVQAQSFELREKMQSLQDTVERTVVRSPQAGTVLDLQVHTLGAVARPGAKLLDIVPQGERLVVEAKVSPVDIDRVRIGQIADIRFTAFKTRDTPKVDGKVIALSADVLVDEADARKTSYYLARVDITPQGLRDLTRQKLDLVAGMPAEVLINTGQRTLFDYLIDPLKNTVARSLTEDWTTYAVRMDGIAAACRRAGSRRRTGSEPARLLPACAGIQSYRENACIRHRAGQGSGGRRRIQAAAAGRFHGQLQFQRFARDPGAGAVLRRGAQHLAGEPGAYRSRFILQAAERAVRRQAKRATARCGAHVAWRRRGRPLPCGAAGRRRNHALGVGEGSHRGPVEASAVHA